ncbi:ABC transporter ATP-binding protein [Maribellus maritimus]|uniref:ABC transporter ATP-binding protein n=1 Tax=Maribellus maritimus TaxID=2870838 RepID=UPI001EEACF0E|nr:ATP-binding cassette domain-containing protein [Maribellus maritimus]MCG6185861.1 ATP-binding cassette domain-containing protein [Maribellus maritimus]
MITISNLTISYNGKKVIDDLNLSMKEGFIHGIVGLNGAGKTTLLNTLFGLKKADAGTMLFDDHKLNKKAVAYLVTENFFYLNITGREYLNLFKNDAFKTEEWNRLFGLPLDRIIDGYSTGMKKKLALLGILKQDKSLMILDEPFNGLDIETNRIIRMILLRLKEKNKTIIVTSHIIETLTNLCDFIHYLEGGVIKFTRDRSGFSEFEQEVFAKIENDNLELINELTK